MTKKVLVIAAHSDDETLGCAGTLAKHASEGDTVQALFMTDGVGARGLSRDDAIVRKRASGSVGKILGTESMENMEFADNMMDSVPLLDITRAVEKAIAKLQPEIIYTHHVGDLNVDHQITHKAVMTACRPQPGLSVKEIYAFEVLSSTEWQTAGVTPFTPNVFVDISEYIEKKKMALELYSEEMHQPPHSRSIDNAIRLNALRGHSVGVQFAEAFFLVRWIK